MCKPHGFKQTGRLKREHVGRQCQHRDIPNVILGLHHRSELRERLGLSGNVDHLDASGFLKRIVEALAEGGRVRPAGVCHDDLLALREQRCGQRKCGQATTSTLDKTTARRTECVHDSGPFHSIEGWHRLQVNLNQGRCDSGQRGLSTISRACCRTQP